jgi:Mrp family chromosome partitioning ATPase
MEGSERVRRIGLMSAVGGEGKTTLAIMLSLILAEQPDEEVLLVDCDLRHRDVESALGLRAAPGLSDWLRQPSPEVALRRIGRKGPLFLCAGRPFSRPWELVSSPHLGTLLDTAASKFRYVIVDLPAEGPVADASKIQEHLDGILLVVRARTAPRDAILSTVEHVQEEKLLGVLFNAESQASSRFKHYRYSHYSKSWERRRANAVVKLNRSLLVHSSPMGGIPMIATPVKRIPGTAPFSFSSSLRWRARLAPKRRRSRDISSAATRT